MEKKIFVDEKAKAHLRSVFKCTNVMVWKALNFKSDSKLARKIRFTALQQLGGVPNREMESPETTFEEASLTMTQTFGGRVKLVYDRKTDRVSVLVDDEAVRTVDKPDVPAFMELQKEIGLMAMSL